MALINLQDVTKQFGTHLVLDGVCLDLHPGERAGLIGPNGSGKTTILRLIAGEMAPDTGQVTVSKGLKVAVLAQDPVIDPDRSLHDEVLSVFSDLLKMEQDLHALSEKMASTSGDTELQELMARYDRCNERFVAAGGHKFETKLNEILGGLGFVPAEYSRSMGVMSGGQKTRVALAKLLLTESRFLLLDEPTNHLDIDAVRWLEKFLAAYAGGVVIVSHDRYLLDRVCHRVIELEAGRVGSFPGNYTNYAQTKETRLLTQQRSLVKDKAFIDKERAFIAKHLAGQRTKEAQGRRKRLERRLAAGEFVTEGAIAQRKTRISFEKATVGAGAVVRADELAMRFGDLELFDNLTFQVRAGERFGITGPNGTGKTTLLRILLGQLEPTGGETWIDPKLKVSYYAQEHEFADADCSPLETVRATRPELSEEQARSYLARFLFTGNDVFKPLEALSGGEQSRVRLACLILEGPDLLILDEPTNHLDIASREVLEDALLEFSGTILAISHDRYFLDRVVDRLLVMRPTGQSVYAGNYSFYLEQVEQAQVAKRKPSNKKKKDDKPRSVKAKVSAYDRMSVDELEQIVIKKETELASRQERFGDSTLYADPDAVAELREEIESLERELTEVDTAWQARAELQ